jgi:ferritin-like metal-binding protein YciE
VMAVSGENLTAWLRDAHAMENQAIEMLEKQANRFEHYPELRAKVRSHLDETHRQPSGWSAACISSGRTLRG